VSTVDPPGSDGDPPPRPANRFQPSRRDPMPGDPILGDPPTGDPPTGDPIPGGTESAGERPPVSEPGVDHGAVAGFGFDVDTGEVPAVAGPDGAAGQPVAGVATAGDAGRRGGGARSDPDTGRVMGPITDAGQREAHRRREALHRRRRRRRRRYVVIPVGIVLLAVLAVFGWYMVEANPLGSRGTKVVLQVRSGESNQAVADSLASNGVIGSSLAFRLSELILGTPRILAGGYLFYKNESFGDVRATLSGGPNVSAMNVLPGYTLQEMASKLDAVQTDLGTKLLSLARSGAVRSPWEVAGTNNLEGLLGAGSYRVLPTTSAMTLLTEMVNRFDQQAAAAGATPAAAQGLGLTPYQLVIAASIVQKEGYMPTSNFGPVARVIYNRLAAGMRLAMDSTVLYSLGQDGGPVTSADLQMNTPYNTYLHAGLTPTPICFPSEDALKAAVNPPAGNWLYFVVVQKDGTEAFSATFAGQQANEALAKSRGLG
jgi:UPF0755 protein